MPSKLDILEDKINRLVALVEKLTVAEPVQDQWMDVVGLCSYHPDRPAKKTVYDWVTLRRVPYHKDGKRLRSIPDKKVADAYKAKNFDYVTFGGIFTVRDDAQPSSPPIYYAWTSTTCRTFRCTAISSLQTLNSRPR